jgi:site-specific DNA recombinase
MWRHNQVLAILESETYAGVWRYGVRIGNSKKTRPVSEQVEVSIPAIIDRQTWQAAQAQREHNKKMAKRNNTRHRYLLRGIIKCGCGLSLCGNFFSNHRYYTCPWRHSHHSSLEPRTCKQRSVRADLIEPIVWDYVMNLFSDAEELERLLRLAQQQEIDTLAPKRHELETVDLMLAECESEAAEYADALVKTHGGKGKAGIRSQGARV